MQSIIAVHSRKMQLLGIRVDLNVTVDELKKKVMSLFKEKSVNLCYAQQGQYIDVSTDQDLRCAFDLFDGKILELFVSSGDAYSSQKNESPKGVRGSPQKKDGDEQKVSVTSPLQQRHIDNYYRVDLIEDGNHGLGVAASSGSQIAYFVIDNGRSLKDTVEEIMSKTDGDVVVFNKRS